MQENFKEAKECSFEFHYPEQQKTVESFTYEHNQSFLDWLGDIWTNTKSLTFESQCAVPECVYCVNRLELVEEVEGVEEVEVEDPESANHESGGLKQIINPDYH